MFKLRKNKWGLAIGDWGFGRNLQSPFFQSPFFDPIPKLIFYIIFPPKKMAADNKYRKPGKKSK